MKKRTRKREVGRRSGEEKKKGIGMEGGGVGGRDGKKKRKKGDRDGRWGGGKGKVNGFSGSY